MSVRRIRAAAGGLVAALAGLGLGEATAALAGGTSPVVGVGTQLASRRARSTAWSS